MHRLIEHNCGYAVAVRHGSEHYDNVHEDSGVSSL